MAIAIIPEERIETLEKKVDSILTFIQRMAEKNPPRVEYTVNELARIKGYSASQIRRIIHTFKIPHIHKGRDIVIKREDAGRIKEKIVQ